MGGFADYDQERYELVAEGLAKIGWEPYLRCTSDDAVMLEKIAIEVLDLQANGELDEETSIDLSFKAFNILHFQVMGVDARVRAICARYRKSRYMVDLLPMIDEALLCYYRGYYTASLALLFITLERYLRLVLEWEPGDKNPSFSQLKSAVLKLPNTDAAEYAYEFLEVVYGWYDPKSPTPFYYNRHGLLHGMRGNERVDQMNCARLFVLFDLLSSAENIENSLYGDDYIALKVRNRIYGECRNYGTEEMLMNLSDKDLITLTIETKPKPST